MAVTKDNKKLGLLICLLTVTITNFLKAQTTDTARKFSLEEMTRERQNPVSGLRSIFLQDILVPVGDGNANSFSIQPVWPFRLGSKWKLNTYTIIPFQTIPPIGTQGTKASGLGNIIFNGFIRPAEAKGPLVWGIGPTIQFPTRTDPELGSNRVSLGPAGLIYYNGKKLSGGLVAQNFWSLGGSGFNKVNLLSAQYIAYYNFSQGWFLESNATVTANWLAEPADIWFIPIGGGPGKTFQIGKHFYAAAIQGFYNVLRPEYVGTWTVIAQFQFIFST